VGIGVTSDWNFNNLGEGRKHGILNFLRSL
jgi:hypothetical protein